MSSNYTQNSNNIIAFQGVSGANSDLACRQAYPYMDTKPYASFAEVFDAVEKGEAQLGMLPIENSQAGRVAEIHHILPRKDVHIVGEYFQRIEHFLAAPKGAVLDSLETVYSHPQALMQCHEFITSHGLKEESYANTATAAKDIGTWNDPTKAAICSRLAAELYGLEILAENIEDADDNTTVFVAISKEATHPDSAKGTIITSLLFTIRNIPAALYKALGGFATNGVNLLKLESYIPGGTSRSAQFFVSFEGNPDDRNVQLALEELGFFCRKVQVLGVYLADPERYK